VAPQAGHSVPGLAAEMLDPNIVSRLDRDKVLCCAESITFSFLIASSHGVPQSQEEPGLPHPRQQKMRNPVRKDVSDSD